MGQMQLQGSASKLVHPPFRARVVRERKEKYLAYGQTNVWLCFFGWSMDLAGLWRCQVTLDCRTVPRSGSVCG
jgi:hypothetical protein